MAAWEELKAQYRAFQARGLTLDMSRGKPAPEQLALSAPILAGADMDYTCEDGSDARNYNHPLGIPEMRRLFGEMLGVALEQVIVGGNSSLNLLSDVFTRCMLLGPLPGDTPWAQLPQGEVHLPQRRAMTGTSTCWRCYGVELLPGAHPGRGRARTWMQVEALARDPAVKGHDLRAHVRQSLRRSPSATRWWRRLARMEAAAPDFRIFWDNAYCVHHLYPEAAATVSLNIFDACRKAVHGEPGPPRGLYLLFENYLAPAAVSAAMAASPRNIARQAAHDDSTSMVCHDKVNQLRHARFFPDLAAVQAPHGPAGGAAAPQVPAGAGCPGTGLDRDCHLEPVKAPGRVLHLLPGAPADAPRRIVELCAQAGVTLTPAGAAFPGGVDPEDSVIRIAPSYPPPDGAGPW